MFRYLKRRDIEAHREQVVAVAVGASSVVGGKSMKKYLDETDKRVTSLRPRRKSEIHSELGKLMGMLGGVQSRNDLRNP